SSETPALHRSDLVHRPLLHRTLAGRLCPNAALGDGTRFDDVAAGRFALVTTEPPASPLCAEIARRGGVHVTADSGTELHCWLRQGRAAAALVRPDGIVLRTARDPSTLYAALSPRPMR